MAIAPKITGIPGVPDIWTRPLGNQSSQDTTSALFHQIIPATVFPPRSEIRLNVGKEVELSEHLLPTRGALTFFLNSLGLSVDDLEEHNIPVQALERLLAIESSFWGTVRWINIDSLLEKALHYPALRWSDTGIDSETHLWIEGRGLPLENESALRRTYGISGFRQGTEFILTRGTQLTLYAILAYQIISSAKVGAITSFSQFVSILMSADDKAFQALFLYAQAKDVVAAALSLPVIWGIVKALLNSQNAKLLTEQRLQEISDFFARKDISHTMRWLLPLHPIDQRINELERYLRWDGRLSLQQRVTAFNILTNLAEQSGGYTKIAAMHLLAKLAHGHALKQLVSIKGSYSKETLLQLLTIKARAFEIIQLNAAIRQKGITGFIHNTYAHYLKWTLADSDSKKMATLMLAFKVAKTAIHLLIFKTIFESLISYLECPNRQGFTLVNGYPPSSYLFSETCFNGYVDQFNSFPGQPVDTLTNLIPKTHFIGNYTLNLAGKGLNGTITAQILHALAPHARVTALNLSGNAINTVQDVNLLWSALPTQLISLDLSSNVIEIFNSQATQAIGNGLTALTALTSLDLSGNNIGLTDSNGTQAIGNSLSMLTALTSLDLSGNSIGNTDSKGIQAIGNNLNALTALTSLDLSNNVIGIYGSDGTQAIGNSLRALIALTSLDLSGNYIGLQGDNGTQVIGNSLSSLTVLTLLDLSGNNIGYTDSSGTQAIGNSLSSLTVLKLLDLSGNNIGYTDSNGTQAIGNSLSALTALTSLDLSANRIGFYDSKGTQAIAKALPSLRHLQYIGIAPIYNGNSAQLAQVIQQLHLRNDLPIVNSPTEAEMYLAALSTNTTVINLDRKLLGISIETYTTLFQGLTRFTKLKQLSFSNNFMDESSPVSQILGNSLSALTALTSLDLSGNEIGNWNSNGIQVIGNSLSSLTALTSLDLSGNAIGSQDSKGAQAIGNSLSALTALTSLDLSNNAIGQLDSSGTQAIGNNLSALTALTSLNLSDNNIGSWNSNGTQAIGNSLSALTALTSLDLSINAIGNTDSNGTQVIGNSLTALTALTSLDLSRNWIGFKDDLGILAISRSLPKLVRLSNLDLSGDSIGSTGPEGPQALLNVLPDMKQLKFIDLAGVTNTSWSEVASAIAQITDSALNDACQGQLCFGRNLTISHLSTSACSRLSLPLYLRIPAQLSVWAINSLRQERPKLSGMGKEPATASTPRLVSVCQAVVGGAVILYIANRVKNHLLSWWNGTTEVAAQEPHLPQEHFERRIKTFEGWLDNLKIAFQRIHDQNRIPEYESKWYLSSVENYQDDIAKLQATGGATRKELHELSLDIKALHKEAIAQMKAA